MKVIENEVVDTLRGAYDYTAALTLAVKNRGKWVEVTLAELPGRTKQDKQTRIQQAARVQGLRLLTRTGGSVPEGRLWFALNTFLTTPLAGILAEKEAL